ncbi:hypothetical protein H7X46_12470 [Pseudonocardia sp. C8]|uniref:hypothetical protein n=1 Tax=Pseudonocardia sp. C8 TaxID=2762759 RepID=UPI001642ABB2|nr:hypothetical protein [Pseudonocardia sp. C8]MBC3191877.1 hypothetical protein [Pseudonocardia sp. C8]
MARQRSFVYRHPLVTLAVILGVEVALVATLHLVLGWSLLAITVVGLVVLIVVSVLMG